jgi:hypothetical protein
MKKIQIVFAVVMVLSGLAGFLDKVAHADVVASFVSFRHTSGGNVSSDSSLQMNWTTTPLFDQSTGNGALNQSNQGINNRFASNLVVAPNNLLQSADPGTALFVSNNREHTANGAGDPLGDLGETTWFLFDTTPNAGYQFDFRGQTATLDTYAFSSVGTGSGASWNLYFRIPGSTNLTLISSETGQSATTGNTVLGPTSLSFDLSSIGVVTDNTVQFLLDPVSTGGANGAASQRSIGFGNFNVNATVTVVPEPGSSAMVGVAVMGVFRRRRT